MGEPQINTFEFTKAEPPPPPPPPPSSSSSSSPSYVSDENDELQCLEHAPPFWRNLQNNNKKILSKQLSMCEVPRNIAWERRRRQFLQQERRRNNVAANGNDNLTDEDLNELKGCIELGFGFNEKNGQRLCPTIPALDLYFAVNRQLSVSPLSSPASSGGGSARSIGGSTTLSLGSSFGSPMSDSDSRKIFSRGDDPQQVKTKLRHWAQAVACSVLQNPLRGGTTTDCMTERERVIRERYYVKEKN